MKLTHIDLFAGIGGFSLGFEHAGIETLAHVEIDAKCQEVLKAHWPTHQIFPDVCQVGSHNLPYADIITFGSPCQDLSVAGKRAGLAGGRSGLFFEAARIIREINPRYAIWENVPGAMSSHNGRDFQSVLECLLDASVPMPRSGRWASSGMVRTGQKEIAWRILDAQYFGVAQRRRRIFLVFCPRNNSAAEVLFEREGVRWNPPARGGEGQGLTVDVAASLRHGGGEGRGYNLDAECGLVTGTLDRKSTSANRGSNANETEFIVAAPLVARQGKGAFTDPVNDNIVTVQAVTSKGNGEAWLSDVHTSLSASGGGQAGQGYPAICWEMQHASEAYREAGDIAPNLQARMGTGGNNVPLVGVRRLTPTECARLQGFPDDWNGWLADASRYKQFGNAVCVNVAEWIGKRIVEVEA